jgi:tetratricopeptide (TPR) repeat protein
MALSYYGWEGDQRRAAAFLKPDQEDRNVGPNEMVTYVQQQGLGVVLRYGGNVDLIRELLLAGFPVLVEKGFDPEPDRLGWMGHYLLITGYNEFEGAFIAMDSYLGPNQNEPYPRFDDYWKHFNRAYLVIYRPEQEGELATVLGDDMDPVVNAWNTLAIAIAEVNDDPADAFAWFNLGTSYAQVGYYDDAAASFDQARLVGLPWRMLWYQFGPYDVYYRVGRYDDVLALAGATLETTLDVEETFYYQGMAMCRCHTGTRRAARRLMFDCRRPRWSTSPGRFRPGFSTATYGHSGPDLSGAPMAGRMHWAGMGAGAPD